MIRTRGRSCCCEQPGRAGGHPGKSPGEAADPHPGLTLTHPQPGCRQGARGCWEAQKWPLSPRPLLAQHPIRNPVQVLFVHLAKCSANAMPWETYLRTPSSLMAHTTIQSSGPEPHLFHAGPLEGCGAASECPGEPGNLNNCAAAPSGRLQRSSGAFFSEQV